MPTLVDALCTHANPAVSFRARRLLAGDGDRPRVVRKLREAVRSSTMARRLLAAIRGPLLNPYAKWQGPHWTLFSLAEIGYPAGDLALLPMRDRVFDWLLAPAYLKPQRTVVFADQPERPRGCASIEGNAIWSQLRLGLLDEERTPLLVERLLAFQWPDGGWNCDKRKGARTSSVQETLIPLRALSAWGRLTGDARAKRAAARAAEFLLTRHLLWRKHDGALIAPDWGGPIDRVHFPFRFYDVLGALVVMAELGRVRDPRCRRALDLLETKRLSDGTFPVEWTNAKTTDQVASRGTYADWGPYGKTRGNPFVTVDAIYVLREAGRE